MTLDQKIRDFNKKLKTKDLILSEWYDYDTKVFTFNIWTRQTDKVFKHCVCTSNSISRCKAFNELISKFNKEQ